MVKGHRSLQGSCHGVHPCRLVRSARVRVLCARATPQHHDESHDRSFPRVYVASLPLVGWEGLERTLRGAYPDRLALHSMIVVEEDNAYSVFDFLPKQPKDPVTALTLLTGGSVEGLLRERLISNLPARRCQIIGTAKHKQVCQLSASLVAVGASAQVASHNNSQLCACRLYTQPGLSMLFFTLSCNCFKTTAGPTLQR